MINEKMFEELVAWPKKLQKGADLATTFYTTQTAELVPKQLSGIAFFGMGASGIGGRIVKTILDRECRIPSYVVDSTVLPAYFNNNMLAIVISYSGNTWEMVEVFEELREKNIPMLVLTHNGTLKEQCQKHHVPVIEIPQSLTPRSALGLFLGVLLTLLDHWQLMNGKQILQDIIGFFEKNRAYYAEKSTYNDFLDQVRDQELFYLFGVSSDSDAVVVRAQTQFNENSKLPVVSGNMTEVCHNLIEGMGGVKNPPRVVFASTDYVPVGVLRSVKALHDVLAKQGVSLYKMPILGDNWIEQFFHILFWSDFASWYLGKERNVDMVPVPMIEQLKLKQISIL